MTPSADSIESRTPARRAGQPALGPEVRAQLRRHAEAVRYKKGELVYAPSEKPDAVFLLERGQVRVFRISLHGAESTLFYVRESEVFGETAAFRGQRREDFAEAAVDSTVWKVELDAFRALLSAPSGFEAAMELSSQLRRRLSSLEQRLEDLAFRDARSRIAQTLLVLARDFGLPEHEGLRIDFPLTQGEIATLVGTSRQIVNRHLRCFAEAGLIRCDRRRFLLVDREGLTEIAQVEQRP